MWCKKHLKINTHSSFRQQSENKRFLITQHNNPSLIHTDTQHNRSFSTASALCLLRGFDAGIDFQGKRGGKWKGACLQESSLLCTLIIHDPSWYQKVSSPRRTVAAFVLARLIDNLIPGWEVSLEDMSRRSSDDFCTGTFILMLTSCSDFGFMCRNLLKPSPTVCLIACSCERS